jgi:hypothetical protein
MVGRGQPEIHHLFWSNLTTAKKYAYHRTCHIWLQILSKTAEIMIVKRLLCPFLNDVAYMCDQNIYEPTGCTTFWNRVCMPHKYAG